MADNPPNIGALIEENENPERDAIHIAVVPLIAGEDWMYAGQRVRLAHGSKEIALRGDYNNDEDCIGVIDPFLNRDVRIEKGTKFWCMLFPGSVVGLRHHYHHPVLDAAPLDMNEHELWIRQFCDRWNFSYEELLENAINDGDWRYVIARGQDLHDRGELGEDHDLFWQHLEALTGEKYDGEHRRGMGWSCSC